MLNHKYASATEAFDNLIHAIATSDQKDFEFCAQTVKFEEARAEAEALGRAANILDSEIKLIVEAAIIGKELERS